MSYSDPALIRKHVIKLSLNEQEYALVEAIADYRHQLLAPLIRELLMNEVRRILSERPEIAPKIA